GLVHAPCGKPRSPTATKYFLPSSSTARRGDSVHRSARRVAAAGEYPSFSKTPRTRGNVIDGKKSDKSRFTTTCFFRCGVALVTVERLLMKPCAGGSVDIFPTMFC